ncbi:hypothetical protein LCGC14_0349890 [marine sediment metagenome]|uniref:Uncharacterized protein n=1 Tax=marine sediment metagenome TaxID=412755 RepID=A0A0F9TU22_9ZZZZ
MKGEPPAYPWEIKENEYSWGTDSGRYSLLKEDYKLKPEECLALGGHCYRMVMSTLGDHVRSDFECSVRACAHCGNRQAGYPPLGVEGGAMGKIRKYLPELIRWEDIDDKKPFNFSLGPGLHVDEK